MHAYQANLIMYPLYEKYTILFVESLKRMAFFMDISLSEELRLFAQELQCHLSPEILHRLAKDVGFVRRTSKYSGQDLVSLCVWLSQEVASTSLNQLCSALEAATDVLISPQGLNERFNSAAVQLLHDILTELLQKKIAAQRFVMV